MGLPHPEELLTTASSARIVGVVPDTVRLWQRLGKIRAAFVTPTGVRLYRRSECERLARARSQCARRRKAGKKRRGGMRTSGPSRLAHRTRGDKDQGPSPTL